MEQQNKKKSENEIAREMLPFALYAVIPILIAISIAFIFGSR